MTTAVQTPPAALEVGNKIGGKRIRVPPRVSLGDLQVVNQTINRLSWGQIRVLTFTIWPPELSTTLALSRSSTSYVDRGVMLGPVGLFDR